MAYFYRPFFYYKQYFTMSISYTVTQINNNIDNLIKQKFTDIYIQGEISSFNISPSGHSYFTLKDERSELSCVMFKGDLLKNKDTFNKFLILKKFERQALHAYHLGFLHPISNQYLKFDSEFPEDMKNLLDLLLKY